MDLPLEAGERYGLFVIDMQYDGVDPDSALPAQGALDIIPTIQELIKVARANDWPVIHSRHEHREDLSDFGLSKYIEPPSCIEGTRGAQIIDELAPAEGDIVVTKRRYSTFQNTELDLILRQLGIAGLITCGILTDACVFSTVAQGRGLDYKFWMVADALAGSTPAAHEATLENMSVWLADVRDAAWATQTMTANPGGRTTA